MTVLFSLICVAAGFLALYNARAWSTRNLGPAQGWDFNVSIMASHLMLNAGQSYALTSIVLGQVPHNTGRMSCPVALLVLATDFSVLVFFL